MIFFENNLLLQPHVIFDSESNGRNFCSTILDFLTKVKIRKSQI